MTLLILTECTNCLKVGDRVHLFNVLGWRRRHGAAQFQARIHWCDHWVAVRHSKALQQWQNILTLGEWECALGSVSDNFNTQKPWCRTQFPELEVWLKLRDNLFSRPMLCMAGTSSFLFILFYIVVLFIGDFPDLLWFSLLPLSVFIYVSLLIVCISACLFPRC
jgi:hypothetical protein